MKILLLILLLVSALTDILCQNFIPDEDNWMNDRYPDEVNLLESKLQTLLEKVSRTPVLQQAYGLMGKRSSAKSQITRRRQKFQTFVGLMGKRNVVEPGSF
ncbi:protachykinin isoform X2 [Rhinichthys klamathensis goyatoka]|uniref:protachykinin isoform X2 n=1 Tax=Rhinichthys klamathensis goyatoka TaxID=3034132 RepID=UPI0024B515EF|nr:protachykinin isoform X2 [Rhinichthys klamathensis goyatoka]